VGVIRSHTESLTFEYTGQNNQLPFLSQTHPVFFCISASDVLNYATTPY